MNFELIVFLSKKRKGMPDMYINKKCRDYEAVAHLYNNCRDKLYLDGIVLHGVFFNITSWEDFKYIFAMVINETTQGTNCT